MIEIDVKYYCRYFVYFLGKLPCPSAWSFNGSSCYRASKSVSSWNTAKRDCYASGGHLAKIDDASEQDFINVYFRITGIALSSEVIFNNYSLSARWI